MIGRLRTRCCPWPGRPEDPAVFGLILFGLTLFGLTLFGLTLFGLTLFGLTVPRPGRSGPRRPSAW